ncbi:MAG: hypothetical protein ACPGSD_12090 [Flavobacteriales bacterium]|jgi:hypothetical protein
MRRLIIICGLGLGIYSGNAQTVVPVYDHYTMSIRESIFYGPRDFKPKWYLWIMHYDYLHGKDRSNLYPIFNIQTALAVNQEQAEDEKEYRADYADERIQDGLDRVLNVQGNLLYDTRINASITSTLTYSYTLDECIASEYSEVTSHLSDLSNKASLRFGQMIRVVIDYYHGIGQSYINDSKKKEMYIKVLDDLDDINTLVLQYKKKLTRLKRIKELQFEKYGTL